MGNSEVGHLNLGAGRPVLQDLPRIDAAIADGSFFARPALLDACERARPTGRLHAVGLIGPGGVHAHDRHLVALVELAARLGVPSVRVHALLDGRDTPPSSALGFMRDLEARLAEVHPDARVATVGGRYYAMDRDQRWERTERGYDAIVHARGAHAPPPPRRRSRRPTPAARRTSSSSRRSSTGTDGALRDGDPIVHFNFRADRARQLVHALSRADFADFDRTSPAGRAAPAGLLVVTMSEYESGLPVEVAFGPEEARSLAQAFSEAGWTQFHVAETEKYAHVTYFFNGGVETAVAGRGAPARPVAQGGHLRPPARDERRRGHRRAGRGDRLGPLRLHRRQLRQPGHGRPHGRLGRHGDGPRRHRRLPRPDLRRDRRGRGRGPRTDRAPRSS